MFKNAAVKFLWAEYSAAMKGQNAEDSEVE